GALTAAESAAAARRGDPDAAVLLARARRAAGDVDGARRELAALPTRDAQTDVERGLTELAAGRVAEARTFVQRALDRAPQDETARGAAIAVDLAGHDPTAARRRVDAWLAERADAPTQLLAARVNLAAHEDA